VAHLDPRKLRALMTDAELDLQELANRTGIGERFLNEVLGGRRRTTLGSVRRLAERLGVEWLWTLWDLDCDGPEDGKGVPPVPPATC
jgi:transcriptional regulator with XRE-family HTH domain